VQQHILVGLVGLHRCLAGELVNCRKSELVLLEFHKNPAEELHKKVAEEQSKQVQLGPEVNHRNPAEVAGMMVLQELHKLAVQGHCILEEQLMRMKVVGRCKQELVVNHMHLQLLELVGTHRHLVVEHCIELVQL
jgi:hypothetical protein